ncbi:terminal uridylyltransferase 7-like [Bactrocera neohumeralis]|uniref:terminal uridylyltransferase 7-like n=1 Tax=Bactrocera neohumeralis TaxID=98809 RepID=UPI002165EFFC|nr:terminal uridylyltransferase 7-like [Bactrocera neohumeralis]
MTDEVQLSKRLLWVLRHGAVKEGIPIRFDGFVPVTAILNHPKFARDFNFRKLQEIVKKDQEKRLALRHNKNGFWEIRANDGHSMVNVARSHPFQPYYSVNSINKAIYGAYLQFERMFMEEFNAMVRPHANFKTYGYNRNYYEENNAINPPIKTATLGPVNTVNSNGNKVKTKKIDFKCTICSKKFSKDKDCMKHERWEHDIKRSRKSLSDKVEDIIAYIESDEQQLLQKESLNALQNCEPGQELSSIFKQHKMNDETLSSVYKSIEACLKNVLRPLKGVELHPFGSIASGLALKDSDIDLYIELLDNTQTTGNSTRQAFNRINIILQRSNDFNEVIPIRQARVPIIKCKHTPTGFRLDINLSCSRGVHNTKFVRDLLQFDNRIHELITFLKIWAKQLQLIGRGNMSSHCLITLVLFYLQQPQSNQPAVLPAVKDLQENVPDNLIMGVNYAYQLQEKTSQIPQEWTTSKLIEGFFKFYRCFEFEKMLISPYLGKAIPLDKFKKGLFKFPAYDAQQCDVAAVSNEPVQPIPLADRCVCVQDAFVLSHNVGKAISRLHLEYFRKCLNLACDVYEDVDISTDAQRYEALLYGIFERVAQSVNIKFAFPR